MRQEIVRAAIHPGVGIARMGNAEKYFIAPQVTTPAPKPVGFYHADGFLKREAAEFRIYGYDGDGKAVAELSPENAEIEWTVHLAATKASWYKFIAAMDLPEAVVLSAERRNPTYDADKRDDLVIDPGPRSISGRNGGGTSGTRFEDRFRYKDRSADAMIGELRTDTAGRLHVLSGFGVSGSPAGLPVFVKEEQDAFGNATGWYDEVCDGPVTASVKIGDRTIPCEGAWVAVAPPNYAPEIIGWRTLLDMLEELWQDAGWITPPTQVSFTRDIYPILGRLSGLQWVNQGFVAYFGAGGPLDFTDPELIDRLARVHGSADTYAALRRQIFNGFRPASGDGVALRSQPWIYGDAFGTFSPTSPRNGLPLWPRAAAMMRRWVAGDFVADWGQQPPQPDEIGQVDLPDQPAMLDRAALHFCVADAFHPGTELTWPLRHLSLWERPFRIRARPVGDDEPDYGEHLTADRALGPDGPLNAQVPGGLTRWMALPWQVDTAGCRSGYDTDYDPNLPTFWPARVPDHVLTEENYQRLMDTNLSDDVRIDAYRRRRSWYFPLSKYGTDEMTLMVQHYAEMGIVERRDGPGDLLGVPKTVFVEALPAFDAAIPPTAEIMLAGVPSEVTDTPEDTAAREAGWQNEAQRQFFRAARMASTIAGSYDK